MIIHRSTDDRPVLSDRWESRWEGPDIGLTCSWLRGIEKARNEPALRDAALRGELPVLAWKGGGAAIKAGKRLGSLHYLATWQGLRGEDLNIDSEVGAVLTCTLTGIVATFTDDVQALTKAAAAECGEIE